MAKQAPLGAAASEAVKENKGRSRVSVMPVCKDGHPSRRDASEGRPSGRRCPRSSTSRKEPDQAPSSQLAVASFGLIGRSVCRRGARRRTRMESVEQATARRDSAGRRRSDRIGMPRTDLNVTVKGVPVGGNRPGSYARIKQTVTRDGAWRSRPCRSGGAGGDVRSALFAGGLEVMPFTTTSTRWSPHGLT